jgi:hypothetical protein
MCDDGCRFPATISIGSLLCVAPRASGRHHRRSKLPRRAKDDVTRCPSCIQMLLALMWARASCSSPSALIETPIPSAASHLHSRPACTGRLAGAVRDSFCRDGVYQRLLDSDLSDPGSARTRGLSGQRTARKERSGPENRRLGLPVAVVPAFGWAAPSQLPAAWIHLRHPASLAKSQ